MCEDDKNDFVYVNESNENKLFKSPIFFWQQSSCTGDKDKVDDCVLNAFWWPILS